VLLPDARSTTLAEHYDVIEAAMVADTDPQDVPEHVLRRTNAVDRSGWWSAGGGGRSLPSARGGSRPAPWPASSRPQDCPPAAALG
jgi:hypothetical protein